MTLHLYNYIIIQNLYLHNYSDSILTTRHRCISYFPGQAVREVCGFKRSIRMKLRVDISHLQCMYFPGETARGVCLHTCRCYTCR